MPLWVTVGRVPGEIPVCSSAVRRRFSAFVFAIAACGEADVEAVTLELREGSCAATDFAEVRMLSVEVYGFDEGDELCTLQKRCIPGVDLPQDAEDPVADLAALLESQRQPLIDTRRDGAGWIGIVGRPLDDCFGAQASLCGLADLANVQDGVLEVDLQCGACPTDLWEHCP